MELYSTSFYLKKREKEWLVNLSPLRGAFRPVISHLGINGVRVQPNGPIERKGGERVAYLEGEGETPHYI